MPPRPTERILFPLTEYPIEVQTWSSDVNVEYPAFVSECTVMQFTFKKATGGKEHEALHVEVKHHPTSHIAYFIVHRTPGSNNSSKDGRNPSSGIQDSSPIRGSFPSNAADQVVISGENGPVGDYYASSCYDDLEIMTFPSSLSSKQRPSLMELATLFEAAHLAKPKYNLKESQCYWYAGVIWKCLDEMFPGRNIVQTHHRKKATYKGFSIGSDLSTEPIFQEHKALMTHYDTVRKQKVAEATAIYERGRDEGIERGREEGIERGREEGMVRGLERGREERDKAIEERDREIRMLRQQLAERA